MYKYIKKQLIYKCQKLKNSHSNLLFGDMHQREA